MFIRGNYVARGLWLDLPPEGMDFSPQGRDDVKILISAPPESASTDGMYVRSSLVQVTLLANASARIVGMFQTLTRGELPEGSDPSSFESFDPIVDLEGKLIPHMGIPQSVLPQAMRGFIEQTTRELTKWARRTVDTLRWNAAILGQHDSISVTPPQQWSLDGEEWNSLPYSFHSILGDSSTKLKAVAFQDKVRSLLAEDVEEPLGHQLLREAFQERLVNPRSSLLLGVAALEIGLKQLVGRLIPDASWLAENVPSPPIVQMLTDYLPLLPAKLSINGRVVAPPVDLLRTLRNAVTVRNALSHRGEFAIDPDKLRDYLTSIRDVLWMLDYYEGHEWALRNVSDKTRGALGLSSPGRRDVPS